MAGRHQPLNVVVLGASNVVPARAGIVASVRAVVGPARILLACGHGRAYAVDSRFLCRTLPAIRDCGLWRSLDAPPSDRGQRAAVGVPARVDPAGADRRGVFVITDVGNDLMYGVDVADVLAAVAQCLERLVEAGCSGAVVGLPVEPLLRLSPVRYRWTRRLFFPRSGLTWRAMREAVVRLDRGVRALAEERGCAFVSADHGWYGFDPIHIRRSRYAAAWSRILSAAFGCPVGWTRPGLGLSCRIWCARAEQYTLAGFRRRVRQPTLVLPDGTSVLNF